MKLVRATLLRCMVSALSALSLVSALSACGDGGSGASASDGSGGGGGQASSGASTSSGGDGSVEQQCVDDINAFRASIGLPPYQRWTTNEACTDGQAKADGTSMTAHGAFGQCDENAQDECPGWPGPPESMIGQCLQMMWDEGPGSSFETHGHYINMSSTKYTKVSCGFHTFPDGSVWATQDFQ
jgi:hypothetical protein